MKEYRFFISSTFKDMQQERDIIRSEVFPELEIFAKQYNIAVSIIDLRWGINTEECENSDESSFKIFRTCFDEIDESKPFFVGLVGNRYGWIPDLNQLPLSLDSKFKDFLKFQGKSITESEMLYAIDTFESEGLFVFAFRNEIRGELSSKDKEIYLSGSLEDEERIKDLKKRLKENRLISYFDYDVNIENGRLNLKEFAARLTKLIENKILLTIEENENKNEIDKILEEQDSAIELNHTTFSGRENVFEELEKYYQSNNCFIGISGESGTGKSSLIQEEIYRKKADKNIYTLSFLLGSGEGSKDVRYALGALLYQAKQLNKNHFDEKYLDINNVDDNFDSLVNDLSMELTQLAKKKRVYIYLDALDQLIDNGRGYLSYLNTRYFSLENIDIKIITTFIPRKTINDELKLKLFRVMEIPPLSESDVINITKKRLSREKKSLSSNGIQAIVNKNSNGTMCASSPLYLALLLQQIVNLDYLDFAKIEELKSIKNDEEAIYDYIESIIKNAPTDLRGEMFNIIDSASSKINREFVYYALGIISMSRNGVREIDLQGIFNILNIHYESTDFSYLRKMFRHFLSSHSSYIDFNHKIIDDILEDYYFEQNKEDSIRVSLKTLEYLDTLDDDDEFKRNEYFYYAYKANNKEIFYKHLKETDYLEPFYNLFEQIEISNTVGDFFFELTLIDNNTIVKLIDNIHFLNYLGRKKLLLLLLENKNIDELSRIKALHLLSYDEKNFGNNNSSDHLSKVMMNEALKYNLYLDEAFSLRGNILINRFKYYELKRLLKKINGKVDKSLIDKYQKECDLVFTRKKEKTTYLSSEETLDLIKKSSINELYDSQIIIEKNVSKNIAVSSKIVNLLLLKEKENRDSALNSGVREIASYSYVLYLLGLIYLSTGEKEKGKESLTKGYRVLNSIFELLEEKRDLALLGEFTNLLKRMKVVSYKDEREKYKVMRKHGVNDLTFSESRSRTFALTAVFSGIFLVLFVFDLVLNTNVYLLSYYFAVPANSFIFTYIEYSFEILAFIAMFPTVYFLMSYLLNSHRYSSKAINDLMLSLLFFVITALSTVMFIVMVTRYYTTEFVFSETMFFLINSIIGAASITLITYSVRNFSKKEIVLIDKVENSTLKTRKSVETLILLAVGVAFIIISVIQFAFHMPSFNSEDYVEKKVGKIATLISILGPTVTSVVGFVLYAVSALIERRRIDEN